MSLDDIRKEWYLGVESIDDISEAHGIVDSGIEVGSNGNCIDKVEGVLAGEDPARGVGIHRLRTHHDVQPRTIAENTAPNSRDLVSSQAQVAETRLSGVSRRQV